MLLKPEEERELLNLYAERFEISDRAYWMMAGMLDHAFLKQRVNEYGLKSIYIYGGDPLGTQLYLNIKDLVEVKSIVDRSGKLMGGSASMYRYEDIDAPVMDIENFEKKYSGETVIITPVLYLQEIANSLKEIVSEERIIFINEFMESGCRI